MLIRAMMGLMGPSTSATFLRCRPHHHHAVATTAPGSQHPSTQIDPAQMLNEQLESASPDLLRQMMSTAIAALMGTEVDALCGAGYGIPSSERVNSRNGYRHRDFDTRVGTIDVAIPKVRAGAYFPD